jgi:hypothetical protein
VCGRKNFIGGRVVAVRVEQLQNQQPLWGEALSTGAQPLMELTETVTVTPRQRNRSIRYCGRAGIAPPVLILRGMPTNRVVHVNSSPCRPRSWYRESKGERSPDRQMNHRIGGDASGG